MTKQEFKEIILWGLKKSFKAGRRRDGSLSSTHPDRINVILKSKGLIHYDKNAKDYMYYIVAFFHDLMEDLDTVTHEPIVTYEEIEQIAGKDVADAVKILSKPLEKDRTPNYMDEYISGIYQNEVARLVKIADRIDNLRGFDGLRDKREYVEETKRWFIDLAKGTVFEEDLNKALQKLESIVIAEEMIKLLSQEEK